MIVIRFGGIVGLLTVCAFYPFLPGEFDGLAVALSAVAQVVVLAGLLFVPIGALWLAHDALRNASRKGLSPRRATSSYYARACVIGSGIVGAVASVVAWGSSGLAFACATLAFSVFVVSRLLPGFHAGSAPLYLIAVPIVAFLPQVLLADRLTEFSRSRAIANSAGLIDVLEKYHAARGHYPASLNGVWPDYKVSVVGIGQFHYTPHGTAYSLYFEQPLPLFSAPGTREFMVYNTRGEHQMLSHAAWNVTRSPEALAQGQGWYAARDASRPHWKSFRFD